MDDCPCNGCAERYPVCHAECLKYIVWKIINDIDNSRQRAERDLIVYLCRRERTRKKGY